MHAAPIIELYYLISVANIDLPHVKCVCGCYVDVMWMLCYTGCWLPFTNLEVSMSDMNLSVQVLI
jgi:hypothetical protein